MGSYVKTIPFILSFILLVSISYADYDSYLDNFGVSDPGNLDSTAGDWKESSQLLDLAEGMPLVADMDGDKVKEIIVIDNGDTVNLFHSVNGVLNLVRAYQDVTGFVGIQQMEVFDIDADGLKELIFIDSRNIYIVEYDGDNITLQNKMEFASTGRQAAFSCQIANRCVMVYNQRSTFSLSVSEVYGRTFNSNSLNDEVVIQYSDGGGTQPYMYCMPDMRAVYWGDVFDNGEDYAVFTIARIRPGATYDDRIQAQILHLNSSNEIDDSQLISWTRAGGTIGGFDLKLFTSAYSGNGCTTEPLGRRFTPVLPYNFVGATDELELGYGVMLDSDEDYILDIKDYTGGSVRRFPQLQNQEGLLISNVFLANVFPDQDGKDLCVFGYNEPNAVIKLLCGRPQTIDDDDTREFYLDLDDYPELAYTIPSGLNNYFRAAHSGEHKSQIVIKDDDNPFFNPSEVITPYGVLAIDVDSWDDEPQWSPKDGDLYPAMYFNNEPGVMIAAKTKAVTIADYLFMTNHTLTLLDNGLENTPAWVEKISFNPCLNDDAGDPNPWKQGTDAIISVTPEDNDGDQVRARVILYYGEGNISSPDFNSYDSDLDSESDGVYESSEEGIGGDSPTSVYDAGFLLRNITPDYEIKTFKIEVGSANGNPELSNHIYNISICPASVSTLTGTGGIFSDCDVSPSAVVINANLSNIWGTGGIVSTISLDSPYYTNPLYESYIIGFTYVSGLVASDNWELETDLNPTSSLVKIHEYLEATGSTIQVKNPTEIANIQLISENISSIERVSNWSDYGTHGNKINIPFSNVDYLTPLSKIRIEVNDEENEDTIEVKSFNFFVEEFGVIEGECIEDFAYTDPNIEPDVTPCNTDEDCTGAQSCIDNFCVDPTVEDLVDILLPPESVPTAWRPIIGLIAIIIIIGGTLLTLKEMGIDHEKVYLVSAVSVAIVLWILLVYLKVIPGWTLLVGLVTGAAIIGFLFYSKHKGG